MSLIPWQPLREMDILRQQMNRLFDELTHSDRDLGLLPRVKDIIWPVPIELMETETDLILKASIPGIDAKDLDVQVSEDSVAIAGVHEEEKRVDEKGYFRSEFRYGEFQRTIPLPIAIQPDQIKATFEKGMLTLTMPKVESARRNVVKVDLTLQEKARESTTKQRQEEESLQEKVHTRAAAELETPMRTGIQEEVRELTAEQRQREEHVQETAHRRAVEEIDTTAKR